MKELVEENAVNHPEKLRELLEIAPESLKPVIMEAITASEDSYQKVLEELDNQSDSAAPEEGSGIEEQDEIPKDEGSRPEQPGNSSANGDTAPGQSGNSPTEDNSAQDRSGNSSKKKYPDITGILCCQTMPTTGSAGWTFPCRSPSPGVRRLVG